MSDDRQRIQVIFKRLEDIYPHSYALVRQIAINFSKIYADVNPDSTFKEGETKYVDLGVGMDNEEIPRLAMGENSTIFYTVVAYTFFFGPR